MKPILVKNQSEWNRLAPVLANNFNYWIDGTPFKQWHPVDSGIYQYPVLVGKAYQNKLEMIPEFALLGETQTVDEYLQAQEQTSVKNATVEPDYKALYTELLQGVKDAKAEMNNQFRKKLYANTIILGMAYNNCIEILTDKTGIL